MPTLANSDKSSIFLKLREINIALFLVFLMLRKIAPFEFFTANRIIPGILLLFSAATLLYGFLTKQKLFGGKFLWWMVAFLCVNVIAVLLNRGLPVFQSLSLTIYYGIQIFLIYSVACTLRYEQNLGLLRRYNLLFILIQLAFSIVAVLMFLYDINITYTTPALGKVIEQGYQSQYGRVWGIYYEANFLGISSLLSLLFSCFNIRHTRATWAKILYGLNIALSFFICVLSGSRTVSIALYACAVIAGFYFVRTRWGWLSKILFSAALLTLCFFGMQFVRNTAPVAQQAFQQVASMKSYRGVATSIFDLYKVNDFQVKLKGFGQPVVSTREGLLGIAGEEDPDNLDNFDEPVQPLDRFDLEQSDDLTNRRLDVWKDGLKVFREKPIFGVSMRNVVEYAKRNNLSTNDFFLNGTTLTSMYLELLVGVGIVGFVLMFGFLLKCAWTLFWYSFRDGKHRNDVGFSLLVVVSLMIFGIMLSDVLVDFSSNSLTFWMYLGFGMGVIRTDVESVKRHTQTAYLCDTPLQLFNAINMAQTEAKKPDLYLYEQFRDAKTIRQRVIETGVFGEVFAFRPIENKKAWYSAIRSALRMTFSDRVLRKHLVSHTIDGRDAHMPAVTHTGGADAMHGKNKKEKNSLLRWFDPRYDWKRYDRIAVSFYTQFSDLFRLQHGDSAVVQYEDGIGTYTTPDLEVAYRSKLYRLVDTWILNGRLRYDAEAIYVNAPEFAVGFSKPIEALPPVESALPTLRKVFDPTNAPMSGKYDAQTLLYLTQPLEEKEGTTRDAAQVERELLENLSAGKGRVLVRVHPRQSIDAFTTLGEVDQSERIWELECASDGIEDTTIAAAFSSAQFMPYLLYKKEPNLVFAYPQFGGAWQAAPALIERLRACYSDPNRIVVLDGEGGVSQ